MSQPLREQRQDPSRWARVPALPSPLQNRNRRSDLGRGRIHAQTGHLVICLLRPRPLVPPPQLTLAHHSRQVLLTFDPEHRRPARPPPLTATSLPSFCRTTLIPCDLPLGASPSFVPALAPMYPEVLEPPPPQHSGASC